jgi:hypothetical protein
VNCISASLMKEGFLFQLSTTFRRPGFWRCTYVLCLLQQDLSFASEFSLFCRAQTIQGPYFSLSSPPVSPILTLQSHLLPIRLTSPLGKNNLIRWKICLFPPISSPFPHRNATETALVYSRTQCSHLLQISVYSMYTYERIHFWRCIVLYTRKQWPVS